MSKRPTFPANLDFKSGTPVGRKIAVNVRPGVQTVLRPVAAAAVAAAARAERPDPSRGTGLDTSAVRERMVRRLAATGVTSPAVLKAMQTIERHRFVDSALISQAYEDTSLPIGLNQTISKPNVVARMCELLLGSELGAAGKLSRVLEIGTGCGYQAAVLSLLAREVYSIERLRGLHDKARDNLRPFRIPNVHLLFGDGMHGFAKGAPYAGIVAAAGGEAVPQAWLEQLAIGGRLVAPMAGADGQQALTIVDRTPQGFRQQLLEAVHFVPLKSGIA